MIVCTAQATWKFGRCSTGGCTNSTSSGHKSILWAGHQFYICVLPSNPSYSGRWRHGETSHQNRRMVFKDLERTVVSWCFVTASPYGFYHLGWNLKTLPKLMTLLYFLCDLEINDISTGAMTLPSHKSVRCSWLCSKGSSLVSENMIPSLSIFWANCPLNLIRWVATAL